MKGLHIYWTLTIFSHVLNTSALLFLPKFPILSQPQLQRPIMNIPNIALPPFTGNNKGSSSNSGGQNNKNDDNDVIISDVIGKQRAINIFASFTRDIESISRRLEDKAQNSTVLAPLNSQVEKLPRKPWENPHDYDTLGENAYEGDGGEDRAQRNLQKFVEAHIVPESPWKEGEKVNSLGGGEVWWEEEGGKKLVS